MLGLKLNHVSKRDYRWPGINTLSLRQNGGYFADDTFRRIFSNENFWISINISLKFVPKVPVNNISALVQMMAWRRPGDKPLSETMMVSLLTDICVTRPQWVKTASPNQVARTTGKSWPSLDFYALDWNLMGFWTSPWNWSLVYPVSYAQQDWAHLSELWLM